MSTHKNLPSQMPSRKALTICYFLQQFNKIFIKAPTPNKSHCWRALSPQPNQQNDRSCWEALAPRDFWFGRRENILCHVTSGVMKIGVIASVFMMDSVDSRPPYLSCLLSRQNDHSQIQFLDSRRRKLPAGNRMAHAWEKESLSRTADWPRTVLSRPGTLRKNVTLVQKSSKLL
jgi:hypothetical protein